MSVERLMPKCMYCGHLHHGAATCSVPTCVCKRSQPVKLDPS